MPKSYDLRIWNKYRFTTPTTYRACRELVDVIQVFEQRGFHDAARAIYDAANRNGVRATRNKLARLIASISERYRAPA